MDRQRFKCILSVLERFELTWREKQFIETIKEYFDGNGRLTDQQKSILEGIYREKKWIGNTFFSHNNLPINSSSKVA